MKHWCWFVVIDRLRLRSLIYNGRNNMQAWGLIVLLISKAAGHLSVDDMEEDKAAGVLHRWDISDFIDRLQFSFSQWTCYPVSHLLLSISVKELWPKLQRWYERATSFTKDWSIFSLEYTQRRLKWTTWHLATKLHCWAEITYWGTAPLNWLRSEIKTWVMKLVFSYHFFYIRIIKQ